MYWLKRTFGATTRSFVKHLDFGIEQNFSHVLCTDPEEIIHVPSVLSIQTIQLLYKDKPSLSIPCIMPDIGQLEEDLDSILEQHKIKSSDFLAHDLFVHGIADIPKNMAERIINSMKHETLNNIVPECQEMLRVLGEHLTREKGSQIIEQMKSARRSTWSFYKELDESYSTLFHLPETNSLKENPFYNRLILTFLSKGKAKSMLYSIQEMFSVQHVSWSLVSKAAENLAYRTEKNMPYLVQGETAISETLAKQVCDYYSNISNLAEQEACRTIKQFDKYERMLRNFDYIFDVPARELSAKLIERL